MDDTKKLISLINKKCPECHKYIIFNDKFKRTGNKIKTTLKCRNCNKYYIIKSHITNVVRYSYEISYGDFDMDFPIKYDTFDDQLDKELTYAENHEVEIECKEYEGSLYYNVTEDPRGYEPIWYQIDVEVDEIEYLDM